MLQAANADLIDLSVPKAHNYDSGRAGHFRYFFIFSLKKMIIFAFFIKWITYTSPAQVSCKMPILIYKKNWQTNTEKTLKMINLSIKKHFGAIFGRNGSEIEELNSVPSNLRGGRDSPSLQVGWSAKNLILKIKNEKQWNG